MRILKIFATYRVGTLAVVVLYIWLLGSHRMAQGPIYWQQGLALIVGGLVVRQIPRRKTSLK